MRGRAGRRLALGLLVLGVLMLAGGPAAAQCSICKTVLTQSPEGRQIGGTVNTAILVMLFAPYLVFGSLAVILFRVRITREIARWARLLLLLR
ncbi:MAG TPA: hypothetical protein VN461_02420 [Vicinamibacteria bacterium]|jgi:hypothetical protein|nr:hypothetical protein [Vicinamibacteria bacterium]